MADLVSTARETFSSNMATVSSNMATVSTYLSEILERIQELTKDVPRPSYSLVALAAGLAYIAYYRRSYSYWREQGISGPTAWPLFGTVPSVWIKGVRDGDIAALEKYGKEIKAVGLYEAGTAKLLTSDEDIMREVMVKDFNSFINRGPPEGFKNLDDVSRNMLTILCNDDWKRVRSMLTPTFSTSKLKMMSHAVNECAHLFLDNIGKWADKNEEFDTIAENGKLTMDIIARTAFGLKVNCQEDSDNVFYRMATKMMKPRNAIIIFFLIPGGLKLMKKLGISMMEPEGTKFFSDIVEQALEGRTSGDKSHQDFMQLMANAHRDDSDLAEVAKEVAEDGIILDQNDKHRKGLSKNEILSQGLIFFLGGFDTVSNNLGFLFYNMAVHPEYQKLAQEEIDSIVEDKKDYSYADIQEMTYLDQCLQESMRLYPPAPRLERAVARDVTVKGIHLKKDQVVSLAVQARHMDPAIWPEPEKYDPDRFTAEERARHSPFDHIPFGYGPRNCIAMRLALMEVKMIAAHALKNFTFTTCEKTQIPVSLDKFQGRPNKGIWLKVVRRG